MNWQSRFAAEIAIELSKTPGTWEDHARIAREVYGIKSWKSLVASTPPDPAA